MATPQPNALLEHLRQVLTDVVNAQKLKHPHILIALSGGLDSTVLIHALAKLQAELSFTLSAAHVNHGLSKQADAWAEFCANLCFSLNISLQIHRVTVDKNSGLGVEAAARAVRYAALYTAQNSVDAHFICLAHHQNDQAETLLLQLARGAGVKGLAGMAVKDVERKLLRPLLDCSRVQLEAYAKQQQLRWVEDDSNSDTQYDRNFMRRDVLPVLQQRYPAITQTLSRTAAHLAEASTLLDALAQLDAVNCINHKQQSLHINMLHLLGAERQANVMRWWLASMQIAMPSTQQMQQILQQLLHAKSDSAVKLKVAESQYLRRYQGSAYLVGECEELPPINLLWQGEEVIPLPNHSRLIFTKQMGAGLAFQRGGSDIKLRIKNRQGGERFKPDLARPSRTLKVIMQSSDMPPWQREQLPLIFMDETLAMIPNVGVDAHLKAESHEMGLQVAWEQVT